MDKPAYILKPALKICSCAGCYLSAASAEECLDVPCNPSDHPDLHNADREGYRIVVGIKPAAAARSTDPETSHVAAARVQVRTLRQHIIDALQVEHSLTGKEIAAFTGPDGKSRPLNSITPRFKSLVDDGIIADTGIIRDGQTVWRLV